MIVLCDTSVFVAAISGDHVHHLPSVRFLGRVRNGKIQGALSTHSLAECYAVLSALRMANLPEIVLSVLRGNIVGHFDLVPLDADDYWEALKRVVSKNLRSGSVFDALILQSAVKKKATHLVTWNRKDFERLSGGEIKIVTPEDL